ncbi:glycerophosphodiester phosphodiesterase [Limnohabitans sp. 2KL-1]|jgi:glycerophosphoryl diester phosphodiesterase|uniref:glycerophosphodiester phosphodiesterase n=1 Tax=Limnohabitans sp. 2KL-1 TaxID=1100699 RepID=UPI000D341FD1|nr:glycerophosphodiester phosphodiesterase [Limnohabitans sp. 2KL-1]PUE50388.1 glycerophosphodiester phosphodiesterase [Limnohabitans sp. 2KL-1]
MKIKYWMAAASVLMLQACGGDSAPLFKTLSGEAPLVIGHRGASGTFPEHTLEAYKAAIDQGADFVEPDLVLTKDGVMIARHEPILDGTTDVATKFADRKTTKNLDGEPKTAYFASDFTLAEIKTLRAIQPVGVRSKVYDGLFSIPTLDEVIALTKTEGAKVGRTVGIYPEIKHSTFHATDVGFGKNVFEDKLVSTLHAAYGNVATAPVFIQSFEVANLQYLNTKTSIKLVQLVDAYDVLDDGSIHVDTATYNPWRQPYDFVVSKDARTFKDLVTASGLDFIKTYADAVGPWKPYLVKTVNDKVDRSGDGKITDIDRRVDGSTGVIEMAHQKGLLVHTWTFRGDSGGYDLGFKDVKTEIQYYMNLGIDGVFSDFPAAGVAALKALRGY